MSLSIDTQIKQTSSKFARGSWGILRYKLPKREQIRSTGIQRLASTGTLLLLRKKKTSMLYYVGINFIEGKQLRNKTNKATKIRVMIEKRKSLPIISLGKRSVIRSRLSTLSHDTITTSAQHSHNVGCESEKVIRREYNATISTQKKYLKFVHSPLTFAKFFSRSFS